MTIKDLSLKVEAGSSLRTLAVEKIRAEISEGRLAPGLRLIERDLGNALGVSRTVVREAIRQLEAEGYVTQIPRTGPIVSMLDAETIRSIYEIREALEGVAAGLFVQRATQGDRDEIRDVVALARKCRDDTDYGYVIGLMERLYRALFRGSGNDMIEAVLAPMTGRVHMLRVLATGDHQLEMCLSITDFGEVLIGHDPDKATSLARERIRQGAAFALDAFNRS